MNRALVLVLALALVVEPVAAFAQTYPTTKTIPTPTRTGTAPTQVSAETTATLVFASTAGICSVTVVNQGSNVVTCGQTSAVTAGARGLPLNPTTVVGGAGGSVTFSNYGGNVYCIATTAATNVGVQPTRCP